MGHIRKELEKESSYLTENHFIDIQELAKLILMQKNNLLHLKVQGLFLPLRTTFKQASSVRNHGESIWCEANRNNISGFGEGCPRTYVTGENTEGALHWLSQTLPTIEAECHSLDSLKTWMNKNRAELDKNPAAFCAIETALLDLFSKEKNINVEKLLGLEDPKRGYNYTAVLGDSGEEKYIALVHRYIGVGFSDFKVKVNGDLEKDRMKLDLLQQLTNEKGISNIRVRLDANNLWKGQPDKAIEHLSKLGHSIFGIEEPVEPKNFEALSKISNALNIPIILDESLCNLNDFEKLDKVSGSFIANIKVSRAGGVIRSLELIKELKSRGHQIIIGAHVGETSILTRAGMCVAQVASDNLLAQEGGYGLILLEKEPPFPSLMFGKGGKIDLSKPYQIKTPEKTIEVPLENWNIGWGLTCKTPKPDIL